MLAARLREAGKEQWAREEFAHEATREQGPTRSSTWRGLHGIGGLRSTKQLAAARAMWERRDEIASREDLSPHRVIKDRDIVAAAKESPRGREAFDRSLPDLEAWCRRPSPAVRQRPAPSDTSAAMKNSQIAT